MVKYLCLAVSMGYLDPGAPISLTFIAKPYEEQKLLEMGFAFEQLTKVRKLPTNYK